MAIMREHRGPRQYAFRGHAPMRKHSVFKAHQRRALRGKKRKLISPTAARRPKATAYKSLTWKVPSSYRPARKRASYKPARAPVSAMQLAAALKASRMR